MLYISIIFLVIFIFILIIVYRRYNLEHFALATDYKEDAQKTLKLKKALVRSEIEHGEQKREAIKNEIKLDARLKTLKAKEKTLLNKLESSPYDIPLILLRIHYLKSFLIIRNYIVF